MLTHMQSYNLKLIRYQGYSLLADSLRIHFDLICLEHTVCSSRFEHVYCLSCVCHVKDDS
jgi:hypothetical protein